MSIRTLELSVGQISDKIESGEFTVEFEVISSRRQVEIVNAILHGTPLPPIYLELKEINVNKYKPMVGNLFLFIIQQVFLDTSSNLHQSTFLTWQPFQVRNFATNKCSVHLLSPGFSDEPLSVEEIKKDIYALHGG